MDEISKVLAEIRHAADNGGANEGQCYGWWRRLSRAQQEAEPVAWMLKDADGKNVFAPYYRESDADAMIHYYANEVAADSRETFTKHPLYTASQPRIDLSQFKEAVLCWKAVITTAAVNLPFNLQAYRASCGVSIPDRLLALIAALEQPKPKADIAEQEGK